MPASRWDVIDVDFGDPIGHEQAYVRPALVVSNDGLNHRAGMVTVCPITGARTQARYPSEVEIPTLPGILQRPGVVLCHQIRTVSTNRITRIRGPLADPVLQRRVVEAILALLDIQP